MDPASPRPIPTGPCRYCGQSATAFLGDGRGGIVHFLHTGPACSEALAAYAAYWATPEGQAAQEAMGRALARAGDRELGLSRRRDGFDPHTGLWDGAPEARS